MIKKQNKKTNLKKEAPPIIKVINHRKTIIDNHAATKSEREEYFYKKELHEKQLQRIAQ